MRAILAVGAALAIGAAGCAADHGGSEPPTEEAQRGNPARLLAHSPGVPGLLAVDATRVYWTDLYTNPENRQFYQIVSVNKSGGGDPQSIFNMFLEDGALNPAVSAPDALAALGGVAYLARASASILTPIGGIQHTIVDETDPSMSTTASTFQFDTPGQPAGGVRYLAVRSDGLYFLGERATTVPDGDNFWRTGLGASPGAAVALNTFALDASSVAAMDVADDGIYWMARLDSGYEIRSMPLGGAATFQTLARTRTEVAPTIAVANGAVYWHDWNRGAIMTVAGAGGQPTVVADGPALQYSISVQILLADAARLYWVGALATGTGWRTQVMSVRLTRGAQPEVLATVTDAVSQLVQDDANLYWLSPVNHGAVYALAKPH